MEDWWNHFEDGTLFRSLFAIGDNPEVLNVGHAGVTTTEEARNDTAGSLREYDWNKRLKL
ncbi:MAG: hypothetical protein N0C90_22030 [Candidatus Thiodiazotropha endolucinida]|nr:hypothetical protein [Candidatus Thiodiazotropha taylori]MCW4264035.1 hypothetical protein [Candidatus Thiodiazotropha endolucinida]